MRRAAVLLLPLILLPLSACNRATDVEGRADTAIAFVPVDTEGNAAENRATALRLAEIRAKDQILVNLLDLTFPNGVTLEEAAIADPFIRAKLYDTVRTAQVVDRAINTEGIASVEIRMSLEPVYEILESPPPPVESLIEPMGELPPL